MRQLIEDYVGDPEYDQFLKYIEDTRKANATAKSYRTSYRKLRHLLGKPLRETAQDTLIGAVSASIENINSVQALLNIAIICREQLEPKMPIEMLTNEREKNKEIVQETLKQNNTYIVLPTLDEFDNFLEQLWKGGKCKDYIINYLIRHHYVRNQDLLFDVVDKKSEINTSGNYIWIDRRNQRCVYFRNKYKTAGTYGPKQTIIDNERFLSAIKKCHRAMTVFPLTDSEEKIGYHVQKSTFRKLGEGLCLKIIINHYKGDINRLKEISASRGTDIGTLLTSYNITYNDVDI